MGILITGATGFVGKNLIRMMLAQGYSNKELILAMSKFGKEYADAGFRVLVHRNYTYTSEELQKLLMPGECIDAVIHLGATTPKGSEKDEEADYGENVRTTEHLINELPNVPKSFIFGSSVSIYNTDLGTADGRYGASKRQCEQLLQSRLQNTDLWILRFGPIYGPGEESYHKIAGTFLKKAMSGEDIMLKGDGSAVRHMVYIDDLCRKVLLTLAKEQKEEPQVHILDIVNQEPITILQLATYAVQIAGGNSVIRMEEEPMTKSQTRSEEYLVKKGDTSYWEGMQRLYSYLKELT